MPARKLVGQMLESLKCLKIRYQLTAAVSGCSTPQQILLHTAKHDFNQSHLLLEVCGMMDIIIVT